MLESALSTSHQTAHTPTSARGMEAERMPGTPPGGTGESYPPDSRRAGIARRLAGAEEMAYKGDSQRFAHTLAEVSPRSGPAGMHTAGDNASPGQQNFGFGDLVDMVNPLQHIPLVGNIYRGISGDEIKPISRIMGGALYGGPAGAASSTVNVVVEAETGRDITGNVIGTLSSSDKTDTRQAARAYTPHDQGPEARLNNAAAAARYNAIQPGSDNAIAFHSRW